MTRTRVKWLLVVLALVAGCEEETGYGNLPGGSTQELLPCGVAEVLSNNCWECHGNLTNFGAPMSLTSLAHFKNPSPNTGAPMSQQVSLRIHDVQRPMPPAQKPQLTQPELAVLDNWIASGLPSGTCTMRDPNVPDTFVNPGTGGMSAVGSGGMAAVGSGGSDAVGSGGTTAVNEPPPVAGEECFRITAHNGDKTTPYAVPTTPDYYVEFSFTPPWGSGTVHGLKAKSIIDNSRSIHHWILYSAGGGVSDGAIGPGTGQHSGGQFIVGWAPGTGDLIMPDGVGLQIPSGGLILEIHYNAPSAGQTDASGVEMCITRELLPQTAATHPLGQEGFSLNGAGKVCGVCDPRGTMPITIISTSPHMHKKGTHMKTVVRRAGGGEEVLIDMPFSFDGQIAYDRPMTIMPGDTLYTECTFGSSVRFGTGTNEEMCYNFVLAYPAGALSGGGGLSNNGNNCIDDPVFPLPGGSGCN